jgi:hypothetical protein
MGSASSLWYVVYGLWRNGGIRVGGKGRKNVGEESRITPREIYSGGNEIVAGGKVGSSYGKVEPDVRGGKVREKGT